MVAAIAVGATVVNGFMSSKASKGAARVQQQGAERATALLEPWAATGVRANEAQADLIGLNGAGPQGTSIEALKGGAEFGALKKTGEEAILANASATGGLRGGNVQGALAQYDQTLLGQLINQQYARLGGLSRDGFNAVNGQASAAGDAGAAEAGGILGSGKAMVGTVNGLANAAGVYMGGRPPPPATVITPNGAPMIGDFGGGPQFA